MVLGTYQHYKGGIYYLMGAAQHTETGEKLVIYIDSQGKTWVRPREMFFEWIEVDGKLVHRFKLLSMPTSTRINK